MVDKRRTTEIARLLVFCVPLAIFSLSLAGCDNPQPANNANVQVNRNTPSTNVNVSVNDNELFDKSVQSQDIEILEGKDLRIVVFDGFEVVSSDKKGIEMVNDSDGETFGLYSCGETKPQISSSVTDSEALHFEKTVELPLGTAEAVVAKYDDYVVEDAFFAYKGQWYHSSIKAKDETHCTELLSGMAMG